jgi:hypothetical protein
MRWNIINLERESEMKNLELGKQAAKSANWKWIPGMLPYNEERVVEVEKGFLILGEITNQHGYCMECCAKLEKIAIKDAIPDFNDLTTKLLLWYLVKDKKLSPEDHIETLVAALE